METWLNCILRKTKDCTKMDNVLKHLCDLSRLGKKGDWYKTIDFETNSYSYYLILKNDATGVFSRPIRGTELLKYFLFGRKKYQGIKHLIPFNLVKGV